jgi:hypothetical protein
MKLTVAAAVGFLAVNLVLSGQGPVKCDPNTPIGTGQEDYQPRDKPSVDRCEGMYQAKYNGVSHFVVVSFLPDSADKGTPASQPASKDVVIDWPAGLKGPLAVFVHHFGDSEDYRLDAEVDAAKNVYSWSARILTLHGIAIPELNAAARVTEPVAGQSTTVYVPVRINPTLSPATTVAWSSNFKLGLRIDTPIDDAKYDLVYIGTTRKPLQTQQAVKGGPFGLDSVLIVPLVLNDRGLYSFSLTASQGAGLPAIQFSTYIRR